MTVSELFKRDVIISSLHLTRCPTSCQPLQKRQGNKNVNPCKVLFLLRTKGITITLYKLSILFMHFYFRPSFVTVRSQSRTDSPQFLFMESKIFYESCVPCEFGEVRIWLGCQSNLAGAGMNLCRTLPEVPFARFARSSCGRLFNPILDGGANLHPQPVFLI